MMAEISVIVPCYNEEENIESVINDTLNSLNEKRINGEVIIVDDGSTGRTSEIASYLEESSDNIHLMIHDRNKGLGAACSTGFSNAHGSWITWLPGDGQLYPGDMIDLCLLYGDADFVIGKVPFSARSESDNLWRILLSKGWRTLIKFLLNFDPKDIGGYAFRYELLGHISLGSSTGLFNLEFPMKVIKNGFRVEYSTIRVKQRMSGQSKVNNTRTIIKSFWEILKLRFD